MWFHLQNQVEPQQSHASARGEETRLRFMFNEVCQIAGIEEASDDAHRRETVQLQVLRPVLYTFHDPPDARADTYRGTSVQVSTLRQDLHWSAFPECKFFV